MSSPLAKILVVDDQPSSLAILTESLSEAGYEVAAIADGRAALHQASADHPDLIVLDLVRPEHDGLEVCAMLKQHQATRDIPVIFVTQHRDDPGLITKAFSAGVCDYITKPFMIEEILARVSVHARLRGAEKSLVDKNAQLVDLADRLAGDNTELRQQTRLDPDTRLLNRRAWDEFARQEHERAKRQRETYCILLMDIDHFKQFNDSQGHPAGDACLNRVAAAIAASCRPFDIVGRYGGEEFIILAINTGWVGGASLAERIRESIAELAVPHPSSAVTDHVTISIGLAEWCGDPMADVLARADHALYAAKRAGRDMVCVSERDHQPAVRSAHAHSGDSLAETPARNQILVVDDDLANRALCRRHLERAGYEVREAGDGIEALQAIERSAPDVVVMDVMMPNMDGLECTRRLKADRTFQGIPVIMASSLADTSDIEIGMNAGADEYLTKPLRGMELAMRVRSMIRLRTKCDSLLAGVRVSEEQNRILHLILEYCRGIGTADSLDAVYEATVAVASKVARSRRVSIMVSDLLDGSLAIAHSMGIDAQVVPEIRVPVGKGIAGRVYATGTSIVINTPDDGESVSDRYDAPFFASLPLFATPLGSPRVRGVLNVTERWNGGHFEPQELEYLELIASIAGTMIDNLHSRAGRNQARDSIMVALAKLAEHRDNDTGRHVDRVTRYCVLLADQMRKTNTFRYRITETFMRDLERAAPLHDIGKVAIPDSVLLKPGKLTLPERAIMETHTQIGLETIRSVIERTPGTAFLEMAADITHAHHEWYDGSGYPLGLKGEAIPLSARITALADVYDALTTQRVYKQAYSHQKAVRIIVECSGTQFDPAIVDAFLVLEKEFLELATSLSDEVTQPVPAGIEAAHGH